MKDTRVSYNIYAAWNYEKELEDLNRASEEGWQLVKGGCFHSKFVHDPDVCYRYQLDYGKIEDMSRYIDTFREQGWEYINSTFNGWHYFRKVYDPAQPEEAYEIFTDRESLQEMTGRWAKLALSIGVFTGLFAILSLVRSIMRPELPRYVQTLMFAVESAVLLRGWYIMKNPESSHNRNEDQTIMKTFIAVIVLGAVLQLGMLDKRPYFSTGQSAESITEPVVDGRWMDFDVHYTDRYYMNLDIEGKESVTFAVINDMGEPVYTVTETDFHEKDIPLKLSKGHYQLSLSCTSGFSVQCRMD